MTTYRVLVSTDLGGDPDDIQSLVHLLHYSDVLRLEGLVSTAGPGSHPEAELIAEWVRRTDLDYLRSRGHTGLMSEEAVLAVIRQGARRARAPELGRSTDGSQLIVERAMANDPEGQNRPLWVLVWGSLTDVAQALSDEPRISDRLRIYAIGSSNTTNDPASRDFVHDGMRERWPGLWWIENGILPRFSRDTFRGYYNGGVEDAVWDNARFLNEVIRGAGTDHDGLFQEKLGAGFPVGRHPGGDGRDILKEGDTPSFLYLLAPVFGTAGDVNDPCGPSWGGRFRRPDAHRFGSYFTDLDEPAESCQTTVSRWRDEYLGHWKTRWDRYSA